MDARGVADDDCGDGADGNVSACESAAAPLGIDAADATGTGADDAGVDADAGAGESVGVDVGSDARELWIAAGPSLEPVPKPGP